MLWASFRRWRNRAEYAELKEFDAIQRRVDECE